MDKLTDSELACIIDMLDDALDDGAGAEREDYTERVAHVRAGREKLFGELNARRAAW